MDDVRGLKKTSQVPQLCLTWIPAISPWASY